MTANGVWVVPTGGKRLERGSKLQPRADSFVVADPQQAAVAVAVPESLCTRLVDGAAIVARPVAYPDLELAGTLELAEHPSAKKGDESTFEGTAMLASKPPELAFGMHVTVSAVQ